MPARDFYVPLNTPSLGGLLLAREENFKTFYIREEECKDFFERIEEFFRISLQVDLDGCCRSGVKEFSHIMAV